MRENTPQVRPRTKAVFFLSLRFGQPNPFVPPSGVMESQQLVVLIRSLSGHVFYLATNKHIKYETQGEVVSLA